MMSQNETERTPKIVETEPSWDLKQCLLCNSLVNLPEKTTDITICDYCKSNNMLNFANTKIVFVDDSDDHAGIQFIESIPEEKLFDQAYCEVFPESSELKSKNQIIRDEVKRLKESKYQCIQCGKTFNSRSGLAIHQRIHSGEQPNECKEYGASFRQKTLLDDHLRIHSAECPYQCDTCMATFRQKQHLQHHIIETHQGVTPFTCPHCPKRFARRQNFKLHLKVHREPEYQCTLCGRKYKFKQSLHNHIRMCHEDSGLQIRLGIKERKFSCEECGQKLCFLATYNRHMEKHARESC